MRMLSNKDIFENHMGLPSKHFIDLEIVDAEGIYLFDNEGNRFTDMVSGVSVSNLGHKNPAIIKAVQQQSAAYSHVMVYGELMIGPQIELTRKMIALLPSSLNKLFYVNSGSEAIEGAMKLAKRYTGRNEIISFKNAYHGGSHGALSILGNERLKYAFRPLLPCVNILNFNDFNQLESITEKSACVVVEPIQAEAGIILPNIEWLKQLRQRCTDMGTLLVFDEIQMGMGRTGELFCFENYKVVPDILCLAKAFGGGFPLGTFISSKEIMESLTTKPELGHITTFGGHAVSCAAALASLEVLTSGSLITDARRRGLHIAQVLAKEEKIKEIRQAGLMLGIELKKQEHADRIIPALLENKLIADKFLFDSKSFRIAPPLIISDEEVDALIEGVKNSLNSV